MTQPVHEQTVFSWGIERFVTPELKLVELWLVANLQTIHAFEHTNN